MKKDKKGRGVFALTLCAVLSLFFLGYGTVEVYVNSERAMNGRIIRVTETVNTETHTEIYVFGEYVGKIEKEPPDLPEWVWGAAPVGVRILYIGIRELDKITGFTA